MKAMRNIGAALSGAAVLFLLSGCGGDTKQVRAENDSLRAEIAALKSRGSETDAARKAELKRLQSDAQDAARLRGEVTQLRSAAKDAEKLRTENQQLRTENQELRAEAAPGECSRRRQFSARVLGLHRLHQSGVRAHLRDLVHATGKSEAILRQPYAR